MTATILIGLAVFGACAVEMVEALTIVLAAGLTRGWRSALEGAAVAALCLAVIVLAFGPALVHYVPINVLRTVVGSLLLVLGLQWLRKAILRATRPQGQARRGRHLPAGGGAGCRGSRAPGRGARLDRIYHQLQGGPPGGAGGGDDRAHPGPQLRPPGGCRPGCPGRCCAWCRGWGEWQCPDNSREVPENAMKLAVGLMLVSFGSFWGARGTVSIGPVPTFRCSACSRSTAG